jgi:hypothetical protein
MIFPAKLANKTYTASVAKMNSANKTSIGSKQAQPYHFCWNSCRESKCRIVWFLTVIGSEAKNLTFILKTSSNEKRMKKQHKVLSVDENMPILAETGNFVDLVAMLGMSVLMLHNCE